MTIAPFVDALQRDLAAVAAAGDKQTEELARRISAALESSARLRVMEVLSQAAHELGPQLPGGRVDVRLAGADPLLVYVEEPPAASAGSGDEDLTARITLRLPERLKAQVEQAASSEGVSVNGWIVQTLRNGIDRAGPRLGRRLSGFARS